MARNDGRQTRTEVYTERQIRGVVSRLGITIGNETVHDLLLLCPFHANKDTPSLSLSKTSGEWICFNPSCWERGSLLEFVQRVGGYNPLEAMRLISNVGGSHDTQYEDRIMAALEVKPTFVEFPEAVIDRLHKDFWGSAGYEYMVSRGFTDETLALFEVGFSEQKSMVTVPVHAPDGMPVGLVGRSIQGKFFKNSVGLPVVETLFNIHRARIGSSTAIVTESTFDTMRVVQAGYPGAVGTLGGNFGAVKRDLLNRNFSGLIVMTDDDDPQYYTPCGRCGDGCVGHNPGRQLGLKIADGFNRTVLWSSYSDTEIYPSGAKDPGDLSDDQIRKCIENAVSDIEFRTLRVL